MQDGTTTEVEQDDVAVATADESAAGDSAADDSAAGAATEVTETQADATDGTPAETETEFFLENLIEQRLPAETSDHLAELFGSTMPLEDGERYAISTCGRFRGSNTVDMLGYMQKNEVSGALVLVEQDAERVLYVSKGVLVGSNSTVLFERLGRLLYQAGVVTHDGSTTLVDSEEAQGAHALLLWLPSGHLSWAIERRVWEVAAAVHFIKRGHFIFVEGEPDLICPTVSLDAIQVAREGQRRHEEFRQGTTSEGSYQPPTMGDAPEQITRRLKPIDMNDETLNVMLERIREAEDR